MQDEQDTLDLLLAQDVEHVTSGKAWRAVAIGGIVTSLLCAALAVIGWVSRPEVQPFVTLVHVTDEGTAEDRGTVAMARYTPAD
jgi:hypothetical protein